MPNLFYHCKNLKKSVSMKKIKSSKAYLIQIPPEDEFEPWRTSKNRTLIQVEYFDEKGLLLEEIKYDTYGQSAGRVVYNYDDRGFKISEESFDADGNPEERTTFEYDQAGKVTGGFIHYLDDSRDTINYEYNADGKLVCKTWVNDEGETERIERFEYQDGNLVFESLHEEGELIRQNKFSLDEAGRILKQEHMDSDDEYRTENEYDDKGNLIQLIKYNSDDELIEKTGYTYDEMGNRISAITEDEFLIRKLTMEYANKVLKSSLEQEFNKSGQLIRQVVRIMDDEGYLTEVRVSQPGMINQFFQKYIMIYENEFF